MHAPASDDLDWAPAYVVDGPLGGAWVFTVHDSQVPLTFRRTETDGDVVYDFTVEGGRPTLRLRRAENDDQSR